MNYCTADERWAVYSCDSLVMACAREMQDTEDILEPKHFDCNEKERSVFTFKCIRL